MSSNLRKRIVAVVGVIAILICTMCSPKMEAQAAGEGCVLQVRCIDSKGNGEVQPSRMEYTFEVYAPEKLEADEVSFTFNYKAPDFKRVDDSFKAMDGWTLTIDGDYPGDGVFKASLKRIGAAPVEVGETGEPIFRIKVYGYNSTSEVRVKLTDVSVKSNGKSVHPGSLSDDCAANVTQTENKVRLEMESKKVTKKTGAVVTIPVKITTEGGSGFDALGVKIEYDKDLFEYVSESLVQTGPWEIVSKDINAKEAGIIDYAFIRDKSSNTGTPVSTLWHSPFLEFKLRLKDGEAVTDGQESIVSINVKQALVERVGYTPELSGIVDESGIGASAKITVAYYSTGDYSGDPDNPSDGERIGDVDGDRKIDLKDAMYIMRYYNEENKAIFGWTEEEWKERADVNKDKKVNLDDVLLILQYFNGSIDSFPQAPQE